MICMRSGGSQEEAREDVVWSPVGMDSFVSAAHEARFQLMRLCGSYIQSVVSLRWKIQTHPGDHRPHLTVSCVSRNAFPPRLFSSLALSVPGCCVNWWTRPSCRRAKGGSEVVRELNWGMRREHAGCSICRSLLAFVKRPLEHILLMERQAFKSLSVRLAEMSSSGSRRHSLPPGSIGGSPLRLECFQLVESGVEVRSCLRIRPRDEAITDLRDLSCLWGHRERKE